MKLNILFAVLLILATISFGYGDDGYIERPWNYYWNWAEDNTYLTECDARLFVIIAVIDIGSNYYFEDELDRSIEGLRLEDVDGLLRTTELETDIEVGNDVKEKIGYAIEQGAHVESQREKLNEIDLLGETLSAATQSCYESEYYAIYWTRTMNGALDALELSIDDTQPYVYAAETEYETIMQTGICDDDYVWSPANICGNISSAGTAVESGSIEGGYGKINLLYAHVNTLNEELEKDAPNTTLYYPLMELIYADDGIISIFSEVTMDSENARELAGDVYESFKSQADTAKDYMDFSELKNENLNKITVPVAVESIDPERIGAINERYDTIKDEKEDADRLYSDAIDKYESEWEQGYLKDATIMMSSAKTTYDSLDEKIGLLLDDAELAVEQARDEAQDAIDEAGAKESTMGTSGKDNLANARTTLSNGDKASKLGDQYEYYVEALTYAQLSLGDKSYYEEQEVNLKIIEIEELISKAKDDDIDVTSEEKELDILDPNAPDIMHRLNSLKERILGKAEMQYLYLQDEHDKIYDMLTTAGADDLLDEMVAAETGIVFSGRIDYEQGLGRLKDLASAYEDIREDFEDNLEDMNGLVANSIVTDVSLVIGKVNIDEPTDLTLNVLFMNKKDYAGTDVEVRVEVPGKFKFDYFDITKGAENIVGLSTTGYKLDIILDSIDAFETKSVTFEKSQVLATAKSKEESAAGLGDGSAKVEKSIVFDLEVENVYVAIPESWATGVSIDGISANRPLSKGVHALSMSYNVEDAYSEERGETIAAYTGETETTVSYSITITPNMKLDSVPVIVDIGNAEQLTDVDISCVEYACDVEGTKVEIFNLDENSPATVQVSYTISDLENYVRTELDKFSGVKEPELVALYESAESMYSLGNYKLALTKMEELKDQSSAIEKDKSKLIRKYSDLRRDIENELDDLESAISRAEELDAGNSSMIDLFESREAELSGILGETGNISSPSAYYEILDAVDTLEKVDRNWLKKQTNSYLKDAAKELENYREEFVEYDNETADEMLENLEHDINVLAATQKAESAVVVIADIQTLEGMLEGLENELYVETEELRIEFQALKEETEAVLSDYMTEQKTAKGTSIEDIFSISESSVTRIISDIEKSIGEKPNDYIENKMEELEDKKEGMEKILSEAETQAKGKLNSIKSVYAAKSEGFSEDDKTYISGQILEAEQMVSAGNYAGAVKKGDAIVDLINETEVQDNTFLILLLASLMVVAAVIIYMIRQQNPKKPKIKLEKEIKSEEKKEEKSKDELIKQ